MSEEEEIKVKVTDKRHWVNEDDDNGGEANLDMLPTYVQNLERQLAVGDTKLKEYVAAFKEKMAENDQFRARLQKDVDRRVEVALASMLKEIVPAIDNLTLAVDSAKGSNDIEKLIEGVSMTQAALLNALKNCGMKEVDCLGEEFNPAIAEAVGVEPVSEMEKENKVAQVLQPGYMLGDLLVRPARVKVGKLIDG